MTCDANRRLRFIFFLLATSLLLGAASALSPHFHMISIQNASLPFSGENLSQPLPANMTFTPPPAFSINYTTTSFNSTLATAPLLGGSSPQPVWDEQQGFTFSQNYTSLSYNVTTVAQNGTY